MGIVISFALVIFIFLRIVSNPVANALQKNLTLNNSSLIINLYSYLFLSLCSLPFSFSIFSASYSIEFWFYVFIAGFLCSLGTLCMIKAVSIGDLSVLGPLNSYKSVIGLISAFIFLKEIPSLFGILGMFLIIFGSRFIFSSEDEGFSFALLKRKDIQLRILALLLTGTEAAILKKIILMSNVTHCFILWCFMGLFWSFIFVLCSKKNVKLALTKDYFVVILISLCLGLMQYSTNYVFNRIPVSLALSLFQLSAIVTVFLGYKFFNEKDLKRKLIGSFIMIAGSVCIFLV